MNRIHFVAGPLALVLTASVASAQQSAAAYTHATRYNEAGQVTGTIAPDPDGTGILAYKATRNTYETTGAAKGLIIKVESGELSIWHNESVAPSAWSGFAVHLSKTFSYDGYGRKSSERVIGSDGLTVEALTQWSHDDWDRVRCKAVRMNKALNFASAPADACVPGTVGSDGPDRITRYSYNDLDMVLTEERAVGTAIQQTYVTNTYAGRTLTSQTDAKGNRTELRYNAKWWLEKRVYPSPNSPGSVNEADYNEYGYDANGNVLTERKRSGATITYSYDDLNRVTRKDLSDNSRGDDTEYDYDARGLTLYSRFVNSPAIGVFNEFDGFGQLKVATNVTALGAGTVSRALQYSYDANGNRTQVRHPDNTAFNYTFDGLNRVNCVSEGGDCGAADPGKLLSVDYYPDGRRNRLNRPLGAATTHYFFDNAGRLSTLGQDISGTADDLHNNFVYNPAGQITKLTHMNPAYAPVNNPNRTGAYLANGLNQYTNVNGGSISYDTNGNLTADSGSSFTYDMENRLVAMTSPAGGFKYDPLGRLIEYTAPPALPVQFLYDGDALIAEYSVNGSTVIQTRRYVHGDQVDEPWVQYNGTATGSAARRYLHANHQGSIVAHSNSSHAMLGSKLTYDPFGIPGSTNYDRFGYTGQTWLRELGINYYKARMYSPKLGRFLQTDPVFYEDDMNLYAYGGNDPMNATDPTGLYVCTGSVANCNAVESALARARQIHAKMKPGEDKANLGKAIALYGKAGEKNGVGVSFSKSVDVGDQVMNSDGTISIRFNSGFHSFGTNWEDANNADVQAGIVAHEGLHGSDDRGLGRGPRTYAENLNKETRAYNLQSRMHQLQGTRAVPGVWQPVWLKESPFPDMKRRQMVYENAAASTYDWCVQTEGCQVP